MRYSTRPRKSTAERFARLVKMVERLRAYADEPCANGFVPISPSTLREVATLLQSESARADTFAEAARNACGCRFDEAEEPIKKCMFHADIDAQLAAAQACIRWMRSCGPALNYIPQKHLPAMAAALAARPK